MIRNINILLAGILVLSMCASCSKSQDANSAWQERRIERQVERTLKRMTTRENVAQLIVSHTDSYIFSDGHALLTDTLVGIEGIGGLLIIQDSLPRYLNRMNELQKMSKIPLIVSIWTSSMSITVQLRMTILGRYRLS